MSNGQWGWHLCERIALLVNPPGLLLSMVRNAKAPLLYHSPITVYLLYSSPGPTRSNSLFCAISTSTVDLANFRVVIEIIHTFIVAAKALNLSMPVPAQKFRFLISTLRFIHFLSSYP